MYTALARKWRPQQFDEVVGQEHITISLKNAIERNRVAHAYLFTGPRGIGKTTLARILAKGLNCLNSEGPTPEPCDKCDSCREIIQGTSLDIMEIDGASNTGVDDVRELRENVRYAPSRGRYKVYIIDEVHMLSKSAFNALLKTLEEPPEHVKFFFATTEPEKIPDTIISRCQRFDLKKISTPQILGRLQRIMEEEEISSEEDALAAVARAADGGMRDAESILDQLMVYCAEKIRRRDVEALLGLVPDQVVDDFSESILKGDITALMGLIEDVVNQGWSISQFLSSLIKHFRDLLVISLTEKTAELTEISDDRSAELIERSKKFSSRRLLYILDELIELEKKIKYAVSERINLEMALIKLARSQGLVYLDDLVHRLEELETGLGDKPARDPTNQATDSPGSVFTAEEDSPARSISEVWADFLETLGGNRPLLKTYLNEGNLGRLEKGILMKIE